jgi:CarD family transcriptional regulator, regulator of rRNA transcription
VKKVGRQQSKPRTQAKRQAQPKRSEAVGKTRNVAKPAAGKAAAKTAAPKKKIVAARPAVQPAKKVKATKPAAKAVKVKTTKTAAAKTVAKTGKVTKPAKPVAKKATAAKSVKQPAKTAKPKAVAKAAKVAVKATPAKKPASKPVAKAAQKRVAAKKPAVQAAKVAQPTRKPAPVIPTAAAPKPVAAAKTPANESKANLNQTKKTSETVAKTPPAVAKPVAKPEPRRQDFKLGEHIVYPAHGVGEIVRLEDQEVAGIKLELYVISFLKDKMTLRVPVGKAASVGMRKLADKPAVEKALETVRGRARVKRTMWSRRAQEYEAKINSGDLISIAEVVRDLYRSDTQPEQSYSERQLYEAALDRMAREIAAVERLSETEAVTRIEQNLAKGPRRGVRPEETPEVPAEKAA